MDKLKIIENSALKLLQGDILKAKELINEEYPFQMLSKEKRKYTDKQKMKQFIKDGFIDRYSGQKLINPGLLKVMSYYMPDVFPYQSHWKMSECHRAYWEYVPIVDHIIPIASGGANDVKNRVTTSMLHNSIKSNWTLEQLNWKLHEPGKFIDYDGLTSLFVRLVNANKNLLQDNYIKRWYELSLPYCYLWGDMYMKMALNYILGN